MISEWLRALRGAAGELAYVRDTRSPFSPWRRQTDAVVETAREEAVRYGIDAAVNRRRAYQVARMVIADSDGVHLQQRVPDAYLAYSPPSAATYHDGKRRYPSPAQRLQAFRRHPQTLAYLLTPAELARHNLGGSAAGGLGVIGRGESLDEPQVVARLRAAAPGASEAALVAWASVLTALARGAASEGGAAAS